MKILLVHNRYKISGGEDAVVNEEMAMLRASGGDVRLFGVDNAEITSGVDKIRAAVGVVYSRSMRNRIERELQDFRPDVVHVHNFFPLISPSVYDAAARFHCPVIQTLHNYRLLCPSATLYREGKVCSECLNKSFAWPSVVHGCYRGSAVGSASIAAMISINRLRNVWNSKVHRYIALTEFSRQIFIEGTDIPAEKIVVKPNATRDFGIGEGKGGFALFVGRLTPEKGIPTLLDAARKGFALPLKIAGTGQLLPEVRAAHDRGQVVYLGEQNSEAVRQLMRQATTLLMPSLWYEGLPMVVAEAFCAGLPVIASNIGSLSTLIQDGVNGLLVEPGDQNAWREAIRRISLDMESTERLRRSARETYEKLYRPESNIVTLYQIYKDAIAEQKRV